MAARNDGRGVPPEDIGNHARITLIKVKRLFLYMAERHQHPWLAQIQTARITPGTGKRVLIKHGVLDPQYQITVPPKTPETPEHSENGIGETSAGTDQIMTVS